MASEFEKNIYDDPNFAVISSFMINYAEYLQLPDVSFKSLKIYIQDCEKGIFYVQVNIVVRSPVLFIGNNRRITE